MKVIFVYTTEYAPATACINHATKIEEITESDVEKFQVTYDNGNSSIKWNKADGQLAVLWE